MHDAVRGRAAVQGPRPFTEERRVAHMHEYHGSSCGKVLVIDIELTTLQVERAEDAARCRLAPDHVV